MESFGHKANISLFIFHFAGPPQSLQASLNEEGESQVESEDSDLDSPDSLNGLEAEEIVAEAEPVVPRENVSATPSNTGPRRRDSPRDSVRKREVNKSKWIKEVAKAALNAGKEHVTPKGVHRKARIILPPCKVSCRRCKNRLSEEERVEIHRRFWELPNIDRKRDYISRCVSCQAPKTCSTIPGRARNTSRIYSFQVKDELRRVCKTMFLHTLGVVDSWVETSLIKCAKGSCSPDKRGRQVHNRPKRWQQSVIDGVKEHILTFPKVHSHYCREDSNREYLETGLSIAKMFRAYTMWVKSEKPNEKRIANLRLYRKIFNTKFNLGFFLPRKDQCELCNRWKKASDNQERLQIVREYGAHLRNKKAVNKLKNDDKISAATDSTKCVAAFDLQKVLTCPRSETSLFFYRNKLSIFNFTVFDLCLREGHCFIWNETEAKKGANEVASNLVKFIELKLEKGCRHFFFYSDGPSGQNRNRMVFSMYLILSAKYKINITHRFLESGHSYSEVDSMHARIENEVGRSEIFDQEEWFKLITNAKQTGEQYKIHKVTHDTVLDFHFLVDRQNWELNSSRDKVMWSQVREISCSWESPNKLLYRYNFQDNPSTVIITNKGNDTVNYANFWPPRAYEHKIPLNEKKKNDIRWLMEKKAIPTKYHPFYNELLLIG